MDRITLTRDESDNEDVYISDQIQIFIDSFDPKLVEKLYERFANTFYRRPFLVELLAKKRPVVPERALEILRSINEEVRRHMSDPVFRFRGMDIDELYDEIQLIPKLRAFLESLQEHYLAKNINIDYFIYLHLDNPKVHNMFYPRRLTPGTFKLFATNTSWNNEVILDGIQHEFYERTVYRFEKVFDAEGDSEWQRLPQVERDKIEIPGFKRYSGWTKQQLRDALLDVGLFDASIEKFGRYHTAKFPALKSLDIPNPAPYLGTKDIGPNKIVENLPRYVLEMLYTQVIDTTPNWQEVCSLNIDTEFLRKFIKQELGIVVPGSHEELCQAAMRIAESRATGFSERLPELQQEFMLNPGTAEQPRKMYTKYAPTASQFKFVEPRIDIERYFQEITEICNDESKTSKDAYQLALDIGISQYVNPNDPKSQICGAIQRYLNVIRGERII